MMTDLASTTPQSLGRDPMVGLRLARVDEFEPAIALGQDELPAYLRRFTMLFADDATMRRGGIGRVTRAVNAQGEAVALKQLILPTRDEFDDDAAHEALVAKFKAAFREEYECHRALSGLKGFPRLYGWGEVDGVPAIVMEWVEGETLARLRSRLAVDDAGRLSPLVAARLGRDLFDLLCRMSLVGEGFVHRDISPANIMVRTARLPLDRQLAEGTFDLCLIDFGSSLALEPASAVAGTGGKASFTERYATLRRATVAYAPPEMLTDDIPDLRALRMSPAIDVYAAASTVYELIAGVVPYEAAPSTSGTSGSRKKTRDIASPYRLKMDTRPDYPIGAHAPGCDLTQLLRREPDVALAAAEQAQQLGLEPDSEELRDALAFVDAQLFDVVMACLSSHQKDRPEPAAVEAALSAFCDHYAQNIGRSLRGEPLTPCPMDASGRAVRRALMVGATVACGVVWAVVVVSAALLASGARVTATLGSLVWSGSLPGIIAALALALPGIAGVAAGALARDRRSGFLQGVLALSACEVPVLVVAACSVFSQRAVMGGLVAALVATYTLTWFLLAMGFAFELPVSAPRRTKAQMVTPLAGGAAAARTFGGPVDFLPLELSAAQRILFRLLASFCGVFGFSVMFNSPVRLAAAAAFIGALSNTLRLELVDLAGFPPAAAAFLGALTAGLLASLIKTKVGYPRISITVPSIVIMVPGLYLYRAIYNLGIMSLNVSASWFAAAILIIVALPLGLIFARILTDKMFRYCT